MQADNLSRGLLAAILVCLVLLFVEHRGAVETPSAVDPVAEVQRFEIRPVAMRRGPPLLLRVDTATGQAWSMGLMSKARWHPLEEDADGVPAPDADVPGRFFIRAHKQTRGVPTLVRHDSVTGRTWRKGSMTRRPWVAIPNPDPNAPAEASSDEPDAAESDVAEPELDPDPDPDPDAEAEAEAEAAFEAEDDA